MDGGRKGRFGALGSYVAGFESISYEVSLSGVGRRFVPTSQGLFHGFTCAHKTAWLVGCPR